MKKDNDDCPLVMVSWVDSRRPASSWQYLSDYPLAEASPVECVSVGWMLKEKDMVVLCPNMGDLRDDNPQGSGFIQIPKASVTSIKPLEETDA